MSNIITFEHVKQLLDKPILSFIDFQLILSYLYKKLQIMLNCKLKKQVINHDLNLVSDVLAMLEITILSNKIDFLEHKYDMLSLLEDIEKELERVRCHSLKLSNNNKEVVVC